LGKNKSVYLDDGVVIDDPVQQRTYKSITCTRGVDGLHPECIHASFEVLQFYPNSILYEYMIDYSRKTNKICVIVSSVLRESS